MRRTFAYITAVALVGTLGFSGNAMARKTCADGSYPPCDTGGETATNNLSVPLWLTSDGSVISTPGGATCSPTSTPTELLYPSGDPISGYPISPLDYYFVQGIHKWQAPCATWDQLTNGLVPVAAAWGDNLAGDAKLKVGSPIRVEIVLTQDSLETQQGFTVVKLDPAALDRESPYGTQATDDGTGTFNATASDFVPLVYDSQAWLNITGPDPNWEVDEAATAEVNATGKVVYGYNLRVPATGDYTITYTLPNVDITSSDAGTCGGQECSLVITVGTGGGGGGGKGRPQK